MEFENSSYRLFFVCAPITNNVENQVDQRIVCIFMQISFILHAGSILTEEFSSGIYIRIVGLYCMIQRSKWLETAIRFNWISLVLNALRFVRISTFDRSLNSPQRKYVKCAASRNLNCGRGLLLKYTVMYLNGSLYGEIKKDFRIYFILLISNYQLSS